MGDLARGWTVSSDGRSFNFELKPGLKFASGKPHHGRGRGVVAAARGAAGQDAGLHPDAVRLPWGQREGAHPRAGTLTLTTDKVYAPTFVLNCLTANVAAVVDKKLLLSKGKERRHGLRLAEDQLRRLRPAEGARVARQRVLVRWSATTNYWGHKRHWRA